jgi:hypothetical protein
MKLAKVNVYAKNMTERGDVMASPGIYEAEFLREMLGSAYEMYLASGGIEEYEGQRKSFMPPIWHTWPDASEE